MSALKNIESWMERTLTTVIDFFYPPFRKFMSLELFRYAACGGLNLVLEWVLYYIFYHFVFKGQVFDLGFIAFTPHIAAFVFKFPITHPEFASFRHQSGNVPSREEMPGRLVFIGHGIETEQAFGIGPYPDTAIGSFREIAGLEPAAGKSVAEMSEMILVRDDLSKTFEQRPRPNHALTVHGKTSERVIVERADNPGCS